MGKVLVTGVCLAGALALLAAAGTTGVSANVEENGKIALLDDCDPTDVAGWAPIGCAREEGHVRRAEFDAFLRSPLTLPPLGFVIGHPSWTIGPSYMVAREGKRLLVSNDGGRPHTLTEVAEYGGGVVPPLNIGLAPAAECIATGANAPVVIAPGGGRADLAPLAVGTHKFQCCFHPWMRSVVKVEPE